MTDPDVVVVGAGPAGSVAALCLVRAGVSVLLVDRVELPRWKVCGACLGPAAIGLLQRLGLRRTVLGLGAVPLDAMDLRAGKGRVRIVLGGHVAISRTVLDHVLATGAAEAGATVRYGVRVDGARIGEEGVELAVRAHGVEDRIRAGAVVDATGLGVALSSATSGAGTGRAAVASRSRIGIGAVFGAGCDDLTAGELRMVVGRSGYVGMVCLEDGRINVAAALDREAVSVHGPEGAVAAVLEEGGARIPDGEPLRPWRGTPALTRRPGSVGLRRVFRVGDSAGYVEPFTGEGIGWAIMSGMAVAPFVRRAMATGDEAAAEAWIDRHRRLVSGRQRLCHALAVALRHPRVVRAGVGLLTVAPALAAPLVRVTGRIPSTAQPTWSPTTPSRAAARSGDGASAR